MNHPFDQKEVDLLNKIGSGEHPYKPTFIKGNNINQISVTFTITNPVLADFFLSGLYYETIHKVQGGFTEQTGLKIKEVGIPDANAFDALRALQPIINSVTEYENIMDQIIKKQEIE